MRNYLGPILHGVIALAASMLVWGGPPAFAQAPPSPVRCVTIPQNVISEDAYFTVGAFDLNRPFHCQAKKAQARDFAGYYAPYAIQATLAYRSDHDIVSADFGNQSNTDKARRLFREWKYKFSSDDYVVCVNPGDKNCNPEQLTRRTWFSTGGLYYQVWTRTRRNESCLEASIAFRGTDNSSVSLVIASWTANLHKYNRFAHVDDEYDQLVRRIDAVLQQIKALHCTQIVSVGHSLGGALAEFAAFAHNPAAGRISKVFTFNASPITGPDVYDDDTWNTNRQGLTIDRIYQRGEILQFVKELQQTPPTGCDPVVRTAQFSASRPRAPGTWFQKLKYRVAPGTYRSVQLHEMAPLAAKLVEWTNEQKGSYDALPGNLAAGCVPDYQMLPPPEPPQENGAPGVALGAGQNLYAFAAQPPNMTFASSGNPGVEPVGYRADGSYGSIAQPNQQVGTVRLARANLQPDYQMLPAPKPPQENGAPLGAGRNLYAFNAQPYATFAPSGNFGAASVGYRADGSYGPIAAPDQQVGGVRLARARLHLTAKWSRATVRKGAKIRAARMTKKLRTANN